MHGNDRVLLSLLAASILAGVFAGRPYSAISDSHRVTELPGWGSLDLYLYAGNLSISNDAVFFYTFAEAKKDPSHAPILLWLTGGPGCSSVGSAFLGEHGPFFPRPGYSSQLIENPHSYHSFANVIYLDTPAFVGFSYSNNSVDRTIGDRRMAEQNLEFIKAWQEAYPSLADNRFWIAGESYAGHYVVNLADMILEHNSKNKDSSKKINFQGFLLGNPSTDPVSDNEGRLVYWHSHGLISEDSKREIEKTCNFSNVIMGPSDEVHVDEPGSDCENAIKDAVSEMGDINIQGIFQDKCKKTEFSRGRPASLARTLLYNKGSSKSEGDVIDPCINDEIQEYLSRPEVQEALHANISGQLKYSYSGCAPFSLLNYSKTDQLTSQLPLLRKILKDHPELRILYYSGDTDALVPLTGTRRWAYKLGLELHKHLITRWTSWKDEDDQVGGWMEEYSHFTYMTIRKASHEAPYTAKKRTEYVYRTWLSGGEFI